MTTGRADGRFCLGMCFKESHCHLCCVNTSTKEARFPAMYSKIIKCMHLDLSRI